MASLGKHSFVVGLILVIASANVAVNEGNATFNSMMTQGSDAILDFTAVNDAQYVTVSMSNIVATGGSSPGATSVRLGFLAGDANQSRTVTISDLLTVNAVLAQPVTAVNFKDDVNLSDTLTISDLLTINANLTHTLPAP